jgi:RNA polymerase sigma factor (sigma-70 family)
MKTLVEDGHDIALITARMRDGDEAAFARFYERFCDRLYRYLIVLTRGEEDLTRELLQVTMTKAVRSMQPFPTENQLWAWLTTIARHCHIDVQRRILRGPSLVPLSPDDAPPFAIEEAEAPLFEALEDALSVLPGEERQMVESFYFEGESHRSLAQQQNTTAKAIESKLARLRQKLRTAMLKYLRHENS